MADYNKATNFTAKDTLPTGNSGKIVKGAEIDTELTAVANAIASKANINSPALTGTPTGPTATAGSNTTQLATTAFVTAVTSTLGNMSTQAKSAVDITGGTIVGITDLAVADGGTGRSTLTANAVLVGNGTSGLNSVAPSTSGNVLTSNGTDWTSAAAPINYVKAWVNFDGTTSTPCTIRDSFNVTSVAKTGTGAYTITFTTSLANANYAISGIANADSRTVSIASVATSSVSIRVSNASAALVDESIVCVSVFSS
jgi:hypothetical protein